MEKTEISTVLTRTVVSEFLGTLLLVFFAVGSAVLAGEYIGTFGIALAFGFTMVALAYALGPISGCHFNPAVTLGMLLARRITLRTATEYWIAQVVGATPTRPCSSWSPSRSRACRPMRPSVRTAGATARRSTSTSAALSSPRY